MHEITLKTLKKFVNGDWELIFLNEETENIKETFRKNFYDIHDLWTQEPCNILYCGIDVQAIAPVDIFEKYDDFRMFNYTDPRSFQDITNFFNADVRYYSSTMRQEIWDLGLNIAKNWDMVEWNTEQVILNKMMWAQGLTIEQAHKPQLAYQGFALPNYKTELDAWNGCRLEDSQLIHWHGSRGVDEKLNLIRQIAEQTGVSIS